MTSIEALDKARADWKRNGCKGVYPMIQAPGAWADAEATWHRTQDNNHINKNTQKADTFLEGNK